MKKRKIKAKLENKKISVPSLSFLFLPKFPFYLRLSIIIAQILFHCQPQLIKNNSAEHFA